MNGLGIASFGAAQVIILYKGHSKQMLPKSFI